ncbi:MAG: hypothetical protein M1503_01480, partial [Thaumarchaeota archaeon]|nr:hypothetical protein [Nitrososphaerota archaeon]
MRQPVISRFEKRFSHTILAVAFILLVIASLLMASSSVLPTAFALGCSPNIGEFVSEGPYASSLQGFTGVSSKVVDKQMMNVLMVRPGSVASFKYAYSQALPGQWDFAVKPAVKYTPAWLNASFVPNSVVFQPKGQVNVTVTLQISKDAPSGDHELMLAGEFGDQFDLQNCPYAPLEFILRVSPEKPTTITTEQVVSTTLTTTIAEPS